MIIEALPNAKQGLIETVRCPTHQRPGLQLFQNVTRVKAIGNPAVTDTVLDGRVQILGNVSVCSKFFSR